MTTIKNMNPLAATCSVPPQVLHLILYFLFRQRGDKPVAPVPAAGKEKTKNQTTPLQLQGIALCLLKTQFAKKPKNPV